MSIDDLFDNGESQTCAFAVFSPGGINFVETIPDFWNIIFGNSGTVVFDRYKYPAVFYPSFNMDRGAVIN